MRTCTSLTFPIVLQLLATVASAQSATSTFGLARTRELAELGRLPTTRDVVVRDLINYHRHRLPLPKAGQDVALDLRFDRATAGLGDEVWLQVGYTTGPLGDRALAPPCRVALVVDCSGSMAEAGKMTAVQAGLHAFADRLRSDDEVALVAFSTSAQLLESGRARGDGRWLHTAIDRLAPAGNTNLHAGLMLGLEQLRRGEGGAQKRRVVLLTDGIANVGITAAEQILADAVRCAETTIDIATIGVGQNLDVPLLQRLADGSRGLFHFVADATDVQKVFVAEADSLLSAAARGVTLHLDWPGRDLLDVQALHEGVTANGQRLTIRLPDLNAGATGVVMLRCRLADGVRDSLAAHAEITFESAERSTRCSERATASLRVAHESYTVRVGDSYERIAQQQLGDRNRAAELMAHNANKAPEKLHPGARLRLPNHGNHDLEVRKNAAIAVLAKGLADLANAAEARRWADADRSLRLASDEAQRLFPGQDEDVQRVRDIAAGHARTLRRYVDRFRDF